MENSSFICSSPEDQSVKRRSQQNCKKLKRLTNKKTQGKDIKPVKPETEKKKKKNQAKLDLV